MGSRIPNIRACKPRRAFALLLALSSLLAPSFVHAEQERPILPEVVQQFIARIRSGDFSDPNFVKTTIRKIFHQSLSLSRLPRDDGNPVCYDDDSEGIWPITYSRCISYECYFGYKKISNISIDTRNKFYAKDSQIVREIRKKYAPIKLNRFFFNSSLLNKRGDLVLILDIPELHPPASGSHNLYFDKWSGYVYAIDLSLYRSCSN